MCFWDLFKKNVVKPVAKAFASMIEYQANDPTTPELKISMDLPPLPNPCPPFHVDGFTGQDGPAGSIQNQACGVYTTMTLSLTQCQRILTKPIIRWPALCPLVANPRSGKMFNAYYDRYFLNFFYDTDPKTGQIVYTCESTDVVAHELGHAILDALRPDLWAVQSVEIQAFHEAFGDINAILTELTMPAVVAMVMLETNGDLKLPNCVAKIGEQMGLAIYHAKGGDGIPPNFALRSAINEFRYAAPETLPTRAPDTQLAGEPHSFSRVFAGGWYDALVNIYQQEKAKGLNNLDALHVARDKFSSITYNGIRTAPVTARFFSSVLKAMLTYDLQTGGHYQQAIKDGFEKHNIQPSDSVSMLSPFEMEHPDARFITGSNRIETARINDFTEDKSDPLFACIVELANSHPARTFVNENIDDLQQAIVAAKHSLSVLRDYKRVGSGATSGKIHDKEFSVVDGRLVRNYYSCWFHK